MTREESRAWRQARIAAGLCTVCKARAVPGRTKCEYHMQKQRDRANAQRRKLVAEHKCVVCGAPALPGRRKCKLCMIAHRENCRRRNERLESHGLCLQCGRRKAIKGHTRCVQCAAKNAAQQRKRKAMRQLAVARVAEFRARWRSNPELVAKRFEAIMVGRPRAAAN